MRQGHSKRMRGRNRKGPNPHSRSYESNGPDVKIRGTALHIAEKYVTLARDAASAGDRVGEQNYLQHAEHYYRIVAAAQAQMPQPQPFQRADDGEEGEEQPARFGDRQAPFNAEAPQSSGNGGSEPRPYTNGGDANGHGDGGDMGEMSADGENDAGGIRVANEDQASRPRSRRQSRPRPPRGGEEAADDETMASGGSED
jgi:hypothetical protein